MPPKQLQAYFDDCAGDGLHISCQVQLGKLVHEAVEGFAQLGHSDKLAKLLSTQIVVSLPGKILLLHATQHLCWDALELPQRRLQQAGRSKIARSGKRHYPGILL